MASPRNCAAVLYSPIHPTMRSARWQAGPRRSAMRSSVSTKLARALPAALMVFAAACSQTSARHDADAALKAIYTAEWTWREAQIPDDEDSQKPIADHLPGVGPAAQGARLQYWPHRGRDARGGG